MNARARIAVLKPDHGIVGGFERVVDRVETILVDAGHEVTRVSVDMAVRAHAVDDLAIPADVWNAAPEYFGYVAARTRFDRLDTSHFDMVLSTQPPSFSHRHPRHLALFYHHHRVMYDLLERYVEAGFAGDPGVHRAAAETIRTLDQPRLEAVTHFLTPSDAVAARLDRFNAITGTGRFLAGVGVDTAVAPAGSLLGNGSPQGDGSAGHGDPPGTGAVLCVGRHEFPKRCELLVAAAHLLGGPEVHIVGTGGRLAFTRELDRQFATGELDPAAVDDPVLWCNTGRAVHPEAAAGPEGGSGGPADDRRFAPTPVRFSGWVDDATLNAAYRDAPCVVAPALDEDYGLTAIEAMAHGRPVVVCRDGGGLAELVEHGTTGLVVEPTPTGLADGIRQLTEDRDLAEELGRNGRERAAELNWAAAANQLLDGIRTVLDS